MQKDDVIYRQDAIDAVQESRRLNHHQDGKEACVHEYEHRHFLKILIELPPAKPVQKTGKWVYKTTNAYIQRTCSACGWSERIYCNNRKQDGLIRNYCPNCGAKMEVEK